MVEYILSMGKDPIELRELIPKIAMDFIYGCKLSDEYDKVTIENNVRDILKVTTL